MQSRYLVTQYKQMYNENLHAKEQFTSTIQVYSTDFQD